MMNVATRKPMTVDGYLAWAADQGGDGRTELVNGQVVVMSPERAAHRRAKFAVAKALDAAIARFRGGLHVEPAGATIRIDDYTAYEPDALLYTGERMPASSVVVPNPLVIVEVLSPSSRHHDTSAKLIGYFKLESVRHYLVIDPDSRIVVHHIRESDGSVRAIEMASGILRLDPPGIEIDVAALFAGV